ncbi:MGDG synthase family glycosyltransferase [Paenibacillus apiarius]|uniref:UDP-glucuronosyltransferase n=1 Tax=Paenibacillus apiarius TaxID=46240 RepID=A0ABT4DUY6_9BACL|nr:glycosyltransferase [Paenibacillus apiarius]MCY9513443.1 UDP-glucuronosyltransferase [Paenibacillus apiarius]MCY9521170.1 UDP-glucuronosyltransferase [Paenibacillus apiarius]MCY9553359.1 UDP-glucuronosyltransferase [Paenibacillus apiarius]MCY9559607.1 UDP-glucuronosyltransferase [Paenibacillus apiarius]MCY9685387.1 UDP-glucuronosyltransferase [Paenibacillus apiarius]
MKKILFLPFLTMPSGHQQVADALMESIRCIDSSIVCEKVDLFHYSYKKLESLASRFYIKWITIFPKTYSWIYRKTVYNDHQTQHRYPIYERLFLKQMQRLLAEKQPDLLVCTHALPSYIASRLIRNNLLCIPVINAYTDFFVNDVWGGKEIEFHFAPDPYIKQMLLDKGIGEHQVFITGIPVHPKITKRNHRSRDKTPYSVLITGGSHGIGAIKSLLKKVDRIKNVQFYVLCGNNKKLYRQIKKGYPHVTPMTYIQSRAEMNALYDRMDGVLTKPGGVTVSESIYKRIPIFIYDALPGQEEINLDHLKRLGLVYHVDVRSKRADIEEQLLGVLASEQSLQQLQDNLFRYHGQMTKHHLVLTMEHIIHHAFTI